MASPKNIIITVLILLFDISVYIILGLLLMDYDDFYEVSKGEYWSLTSMTLGQQITYIGLHIWHGINILLIGYLVYKLFKGMTTRS